MAPQAEAGPACSGCGNRYSSVHGTYERLAHHPERDSLALKSLDEMRSSYRRW